MEDISKPFKFVRTIQVTVSCAKRNRNSEKLGGGKQTHNVFAVHCTSRPHLIAVFVFISNIGNSY